MQAREYIEDEMFSNNIWHMIEDYQKARLSDLAIPQETNLQGDQIGVYAFTTTAMRR